MRRAEALRGRLRGASRRVRLQVRRDDGDRGMRSRQFFKSTDVDERSHALVTNELVIHALEIALDGHHERR